MIVSALASHEQGCLIIVSFLASHEPKCLIIVSYRLLQTGVLDIT